ncbi:hypothetical protein C0J52_01527 [Blattella germanica]|nr:hypothetical protein C0J52_01527 [Blattella germanica]
MILLYLDVADSHLMYGLGEGNARFTQRLYQEKFQDRRQDLRTFQSFDSRLRGYGTFKPASRDWGKTPNG